MLSRPCSPQQLTRAEILMNGVGCGVPFLMRVILPICSTTNMRPLPSAALVMYTGDENPLMPLPSASCGPPPVGVRVGVTVIVRVCV